MRRKDREVTDIDEILDIMRRCNVCRIALNDSDGIPYIVPLNFGLWLGDDRSIRLVFHSASVGHKLDLVMKDDRAAFEMDCSHELVFIDEEAECTMAYESVMGKGHVKILDDVEKTEALNILMDHYYPGENKFYDPRPINRTAVYCLEVESISGKRNPVR